jgi:hypothetical protein
MMFHEGDKLRSLGMLDIMWVLLPKTLHRRYLWLFNCSQYLSSSRGSILWSCFINDIGNITCVVSLNIFFCPKKIHKDLYNSYILFCLILGIELSWVPRVNWKFFG